ncbi:MAG: hypothetical protein AAB677_00015 [Patescibacteria group bacterium]
MSLIHNKNQNQGVALLFAVLMVSIVLTISLSLLNITYKQIILTAVSKESQLAHFIAISALDCVRFTNELNRTIDGVDTAANPFGQLDVFTSLLNVPNPMPTIGVEKFACAEGPNPKVISAEVDGDEGMPQEVLSGGLENAHYVTSRYKLTGSGDLSGLCAKATVVKVLSGNFADDYVLEPGGGGSDVGKIFYSVSGQNTCDTSSSRLVERRVRTRI